MDEEKVLTLGARGCMVAGLVVAFAGGHDGLALLLILVGALHGSSRALRR